MNFHANREIHFDMDWIGNWTFAIRSFWPKQDSSFWDFSLSLVPALIAMINNVPTNEYSNIWHNIALLLDETYLLRFVFRASTVHTNLKISEDGIWL